MGEYIHASLLLWSQTSPLSFRSNIVARQCLACIWWGSFLFKCCKLRPACLCHRRLIKVLQTWLLVTWDTRPCWLQAMAPCWCLVAARGCCRRHSSAVSDKSGHGRRNWRTCSRAFTSWSSWWVAWRSHICIKCWISLALGDWKVWYYSIKRQTCSKVWIQNLLQSGSSGLIMFN